MAAFGKRGVAPELAQSPSLVVRREDKAFDADHKKSVSRIILVLYLIMAPAVYAAGFFWGGLDDFDKYTILPMIALALPMFVLSPLSVILNGFKGDAESSNNSAKYPSAALIGLAGGFVYGMVRQGLSLAEVLALDWWGELTAKHVSFKETLVTHAIMEDMGFGAGICLLGCVAYDKLVNGKSEK